MKVKSTKKALVMSVLSLLVCFSMLIGTTYAWFTDSVSSTNNIIKSGNLDVKLEYSTDMNTWTEVTSATNVFKDGANWEPGYTEVVYLRVSNVGSLALKYRLGVNIASETAGVNKDGDTFKLSDFIEYGIDETVTAKYADRAAARAAVKDEAAKLSSVYTKEGNLAGKTATAVDEDVVAMVVYMPEEVTNDANHNGKDIPVINLGIDLFATQDTVEADSFGPDYDNAAWVIANADATASNAAELNDALEEGGLVALTDDIEGDVTLDNIAPDTILNFAGNKFKGTVTVAEGQSVTMNGQGGIAATGSDPALIVDKGTDVTLAGGSYTSENTAIIIANKKTETPMTVTIEEGTVITAPTIINQDQMDGYAGANVVINGGEFNSTYTKSDARPIKVHGGNVTVNGGTFTIDNPTGGNCYFIDVSSDFNTANDGTNKYIVGNAEINGGTFVSNVPYTRAVFASMSSTHIPGTVVINGGTFEFTASNSYLVDAPSNVIVNDCTYIAVKSACVFNVSSTNPKDLTITVNGGDYTVRTSPAGSFVTKSYADRVILKGGTINSNNYLSDSLADGYHVVDNGDGTYTIAAN